MQNRLYIGDNLAIMQDLLEKGGAKSVDAVITDPPYL